MAQLDFRGVRERPTFVLTGCVCAGVSLGLPLRTPVAQAPSLPGDGKGLVSFPSPLERAVLQREEEEEELVRRRCVGCSLVLQDLC